MIENSVLVLTGYDIRLAIKRGHLVVEDGAGRDRRSNRFARVAPELERVVILGRSGTVTLDATAWLHDLGIPLIQIDHDGTLITVGSGRTTSDVRVRRGQALAAWNGVDLAVVRSILSTKLEGQLSVAQDLGADTETVEYIQAGIDALDGANSMEELRFLESRAADAYWRVWVGQPIHFPDVDSKQLPDHWLTYSGRRSPISESGRKAADPINAMLNYLYAVLEAEAVLSILGVGADPGMGLLHVDTNRRESFALDLMEVARPEVDAYVLDLIRSHTFTGSDFFELGNGNCRINPDVARPLAATARRWARVLAPQAERVAGVFAANAENRPTDTVENPELNVPKKFRTPLTNRNRKSNGGGLKRVCRSCGKDLGRRQRIYCNDCLAEVKVDSGEKARAELRRLKAEGRDARATREARRKSSIATARTNREIAEWEAKHGSDFDPEIFEKEIAPRLEDIPNNELVEATGLSVNYCSKIRRGETVPHARHWEAIRRVVDRFYDRGIFDLEDDAYEDVIAPAIGDFSAREIADAADLSVSYAKKIRRGVRVPTKKYWPGLIQLVNGAD